MIQHTDQQSSSSGGAITRRQILYAYSLLKDYINEYIYILNLEDDTCTISEKILEQFELPGTEFGNAAVEFMRLMHPDDRGRYLKVLNMIRNGKKTETTFECRWTNKNGRRVLVSDKARLMPDENGKNVLLMGAISVQEPDSGRMIDKLTGLPTFEQCRKDFETKRKADRKVSGFILKIDIDNLSALNERLGLDIGDSVIKIVAACGTRACPEQMAVYRDDDEFIFLNLVGGNGIEGRKIYSDIKHYISEEEQKIAYKVIFSISGGIIGFLDEDVSYETVIQKLNYSMHSSKSGGRNTLTMFSASEYGKHLRKLEIQEQLRLSVRNEFEGFELHYQPVVNAAALHGTKDDTRHPDVVGAEALLRWRHPTFGLLGAGDIIPILEEYGLIVPLGRWILLTAFTQCRMWNEYKPDFRMSVNLSYIQIEKSDLLLDVQMALEKSRVNPQNIVLEITESGYIDTDEMRNLLDALDKLHIKIDIDDFGTGYSNMRYLQHMHINTLKLDYSIIHKAVTYERNNMVIVEYISRMAHELGMDVCMEGIENVEDIQKLMGMKPDRYQGYLFGKPMDARAFVDANLSNMLTAGSTVQPLPDADPAALETMQA